MTAPSPPEPPALYGASALACCLLHRRRMDAIPCSGGMIHFCIRCSSALVAYDRVALTIPAPIGIVILEGPGR